MTELTRKTPCTWAIVPAAGSGQRFGGSHPKQFSAYGGSTLLERTIRALSCSGWLDGMVVVVPAEQAETGKVLPGELEGRRDIHVVAGGSQRADSVRAGLAKLPEECEIVLVHDGVRPNVSDGLITRVAEGAMAHGACVPVLPAVDTVKEVSETGQVVRTLDRGPIRFAQTPQGFRKEILTTAYRWADKRERPSDFPDDASVVEGAGYDVSVIAGEPGNIKVTVPSDMTRLALAVPRVGYGYDVHRLEPGRKLMLGGVEVPHSTGLLGHSDGDVATHALMDAILGAAGLGDIGRHFPDTDSRYRGAASLDLLAEIVGKIDVAGWRVSSVDLTIVAQEPRLAEYLPRMADGLAEVLGLDPGAVGVKATTEEGLGFTGQREGISAHAVAVLVAIVK